MPRETNMAKAARVAKALALLKAAYPSAHCELEYSNPLELLIATILSAQCSDKQVNVVTRELFRKYRAAADYAGCPLAELEGDIRRIGLFRNKAKNIQACCRILAEEHGGEVPADMEALVRLPGVGRKTANVVLGNAFGMNEGVVVDTHVARLAGRLRLTQAGTPEKIEMELMGLIPREDWTVFSHWLIWHGRRRCGARSPDCGGCELAEVCPSREVGEVPRAR